MINKDSSKRIENDVQHTKHVYKHIYDIKFTLFKRTACSEMNTDNPVVT